MLNAINKILSRAGVSKAVLASLLVKSWQMLAGALTLALVALYFSSEEQGYFYTFNSVIGLQIIFEMGLSFVILQFSGHYFANLSWLEQGAIKGDSINVKKFHLLLNHALFWYTVAAIVMALLLLTAGFYFFSHQKSHLSLISWQWPWIFLVIFTAFNLLCTPSLAAIEGGGQVVNVNRLRLAQGVVSSLLSWILLLSGAGLWIAVIPVLVASTTSSYWLMKYFPILMKSVIKADRIEDKNIFSWKNEVWPMQWRIAISWISGYFIFQLFTPVLFFYHGPAEAGKMGMSIAIATILTSVGFVWLQANSPILTKLVASKNWKEFDRTFFEIFIQSSVFVLIGGVTIVTCLSLFHGIPILERVLPINEMIMLLIAFAFSHIVGGLAYYLRLHKREPFMVLSVIGALILTVSILYFGRLYGARGMVIALLSVNVLYGLPTALWLWTKLRREWH
jgi:hypothetical protein